MGRCCSCSGHGGTISCSTTVKTRTSAVVPAVQMTKGDDAAEAVTSMVQCPLFAVCGGLDHRGDCVATVVGYGAKRSEASYERRVRRLFASFVGFGFSYQVQCSKRKII